MPTCEETTVQVQVQGTTVMAVYEVQENILILTSADFGEIQATLDSRSPHEVASTLLRTLAEAAMTRHGDPFIRDDGTT